MSTSPCLPCASVSKRVLEQNHSYVHKSEFDLHKNERAGELRTKTRFDTEAEGNRKWPMQT